MSTIEYDGACGVSERGCLYYKLHHELHAGVLHLVKCEVRARQVAPKTKRALQAGYVASRGGSRELTYVHIYVQHTRIVRRSTKEARCSCPRLRRDSRTFFLNTTHAPTRRPVPGRRAGLSSHPVPCRCDNRSQGCFQNFDDSIACYPPSKFGVVTAATASPWPSAAVLFESERAPLSNIVAFSPT